MIASEPMLPAIIGPVLMPMPISSVGRPSSAHRALSTPSCVHHVECRLHCVLRMVGVVERSPEQRHHHVPDELIERSPVQEHQVDHAREVFVQRADDGLGLSLLSHGGKSANVREEHRHLTPLSAELSQRRIGHQLVVHVLRDVPAEET